MLEKVPKSLADLGKLLSGTFLTKIIGIGVLAFYARVLTKEELAVIPTYIMLSDLASLIFSFGIMPNMIKKLPSLMKEDMEEAHKLIASSSIILVFGTVLVSSLTFIFYREINNLILDNKLIPDIIRFMTFGFIALCLYKIANQLLWASGRFGKKHYLPWLNR